jgi:D-glycero-alpha-D-manno-heptose 1-phosphate guanylyltransferase
MAIILTKVKMNSIDKIPVAILAGGMGTRLQPVLKGVPKAMALIDGKPFLHYLLDWLARQGARHIVLCTGFLGDQISHYFGERFGAVSLTYSHEIRPLGTAGAIRNCIAKVQCDELMVLNGDTFCNANLNDFLSWHRRTTAKASILLVRMNDVGRYGSVEIDPDGNVIQFHEKMQWSGGGYVSAGIYLLQRTIFDNFPENQPRSMEYEVLPGLIGKGLSGHKTASSIIDIGTPESYLEARDFFKHEQTRLAAKSSGINMQPQGRPVSNNL